MAQRKVTSRQHGLPSLLAIALALNYSCSIDQPPSAYSNVAVLSLNSSFTSASSHLKAKVQVIPILNKVFSSGQSRRVAGLVSVLGSLGVGLGMWVGGI